ncbi:unnamed protein product [Owenia fusiformis]|uniref:Nephrocystin-3 n=1 Tax=Owenia fusiformis TaxID=6347 RepID=A0A8J1U4M6_OWEFU|nr:unnamed protein product [Owenia fusiformis]
MTQHFEWKLKDPRVCRIFFSSPFKGMEGEREELTKRYWPKIQSLCNSKGIQFVPVDMRWGITTEAAGNAQTVNICLRELDRSDMFVGFFGQRYGWMGENDEALQANVENSITRYPWLLKFRDKSVTEWEFLHGHLNHPGKMPAWIGFRDKAFDDMKKEEAEKRGNKRQVAAYVSESELATKNMDNLKKRIRETEKKTLGINMAYRDPVEGASQMFDAMWRCLNDHLLADTTNVNPSKWDIELSAHNAFCKSRSGLYIGGSICHERLDAVLKSGTQVPLLIHGDPGSGKSALISTWLTARKETNPEDYIVYHFVGSSSESTDILSTLKRLRVELKRQIHGKEIPEADGPSSNEEEHDKYGLMLALEDTVREASDTGHITIIFIDGLTKVKDKEKINKHLFWLPETFPKNVHLIVSCLSTDHMTLNELVERRGYDSLVMQPLSREEQKEISIQTLQEVGKELSASQLERVVEAKQTTNPLFLKIVLSELCMFGYFRKLDEKIDSLIHCSSTVELFKKYLERLEDDYNSDGYHGNLVQDVMCLLRGSKEGLSEEDIMEILSIDPQLWSPLYFAMEKYFIDRAGILGFGFHELEMAVHEKYITNNNIMINFRLKLDRYFTQKLKQYKATGQLYSDWQRLDVHPPREIMNIPWLRHKCDDTSKLLDIITTTDCVGIFTEHHSLYDLLEYIKTVDVSEKIMADLFKKGVDTLLVEMFNFMQDNCIKSGNIDAEPEFHIPSKAADACVQIINFLEMGNFHNAALALVEKQEEIIENGRGLWNKESYENLKMDCMYKKACVLVDLYRIQEAEPLHMEVLRHREKKLAIDKSERLIQSLSKSYHGVGVLLMQQEDPDKHAQAFEFFNKSLELAETSENDMRVEKAKTIQCLGVSSMRMGDNVKAVDYGQQSMKLFEEVYYGQLPPSLGQAMCNIAICHRRLGNFDQAVDLYNQAIEIAEKAYGRVHHDVGIALSNLGSLYIYKKDFEQAIIKLTEAVKIYEMLKIDLHGALLARENLVCAFINANRADEAEPIYWDAVLQLGSDKARWNKSIPYMHSIMLMKYVRESSWHKAKQVLENLVQREDTKSGDIVALLALCDEFLVDEGKPQRAVEYTVDYNLGVWPLNRRLICMKVEFDLLKRPNNQDRLDGVLDIATKALDALDTMDPAELTTADITSAEDVLSYICDLCNGLFEGKFKEYCVDIWKKGIERQPTMMNYRMTLARTMLQQGDLSTAQYTEISQHLNTVKKQQHQDEAQFYKMYMHVLMHCEDVVEELKELLEDAIKNVTDEPEFIEKVSVYDLG